jgi:hypothetical protein
MRNSLSRNALGVLAATLLGVPGCSDASIGLLGSGPTDRMIVDVDGPFSSLGAWRYYDGVRLLECDIVVEARAEGGSDDSRAEWREGRVDLYDLRTGQLLGSDYFYPGELAQLWGSSVIESGELQRARGLRYSSYGPYRAYFEFSYLTNGTTRVTEHRFDCR